MQVDFLGAFRQRDEDEDSFSRHVRMLRVTYYTALTLAFWLMVQSLWKIVWEGSSSDEVLTSFPVVFALTMFLFFSSDTRFFGSPGTDPSISALGKKSLLVPSMLVLALATAEAVTLLGWWNLAEVLGWWRSALTIVAVSWFLLWAGEKVVESRRTRGGAPGSST